RLRRQGEPRAMIPILRPLWDFWAKPIRAESLALFRILLPLTIVCNLLTGMLRELPATCGPDGYCPIGAVDDWTRNSSRFTLLRGPVVDDEHGASNLPLLSKWLPAWLVEKYPV